MWHSFYVVVSTLYLVSMVLCTMRLLIVRGRPEYIIKVMHKYVAAMGVISMLMLIVNTILV